MQENVSSLKVHEWLAVAFVIGTIFGLACLTSFYGKKEPSRPNLALLEKANGFDVVLKGAVAYPGIYRFSSEITMKDLLILAGVRESADLRRFKPESVVKKTRIINVPERVMITVHLHGAIKSNCSLTIPKGSKVEDLIAIGKFSDQADLSVLKKKRRLKDSEVIFIPKQNGPH